MRGRAAAHVPDLAEVRVKRRQRAVRPERLSRFAISRNVGRQSRGVGRLRFVRAHDAPQRSALPTRIGVLCRVPVGFIRGRPDTPHGLGIVALAVPVSHLTVKRGAASVGGRRFPPRNGESNNRNRKKKKRPCRRASSASRVPERCARHHPAPQAITRVMAGESTTATPRYREETTRVISGSSYRVRRAIRPRGPPLPSSPNRRDSRWNVRRNRVANQTLVRLFRGHG